MKLHYTYEIGATKMTYDIDVALEAVTNMGLPHVFRTQKEADFFSGYALMKGIAVTTFTHRSLPKSQRDKLILWAKIPGI